MSISDERAVEFGQFSQAGQTQSQTELVGYYEPTQIADLTRQGRLVVLADGVGGAAAGDTAARYAIQKILHDFYHSRELDLEKRLLEIIRQTNQAIFERNRRFPDRRPIATTMLAALIYQNKLLVAGVGDGRAYVVWDQDIEHLTGENSSPERLAREAEATSVTENPAVEKSVEESAAALSKTQPMPEPVAEAAQNPETALVPISAAPASSPAPLLPRPSASSPPCALGLNEQAKIDLFSRRLFAGDMLVLSSGGLTGYVSEAEIAQTVTQNPPDLASHRLVELATQRGCRDTLAISMTRVLNKPVTQAAPIRQTLPLAPDWDSLTKTTNSTKTNSRPVPPVMTRPTIASQTQTSPRRWPLYAVIIGALLLFSTIGFLAGGYWLAPSSASLEPGLAQKSVAQSQNQAVTLPEDTVPGAATEQTSPVATPVTVSQAQPASTPLSAGSSPLPTPTKSADLQTGDVITSTPTKPQPTPLPTITLPSGCVNKGRFAGDITVKDGTEFAPGEPFEKVWSVTNYGDCPWGGGYTVRFADGDLMGGAKSVPLTEVVEPEATGLITVSLVAPDLPGTYRGQWQMVGLDGAPFGPDLYLEINVAPGVLKVDESKATILYDFVNNARQAKWSAGDVTYTVVETPIDRNLVIPDPQGLVALGPAEFRGDTTSPQVLLTHPHLERGFIEGAYQVDTPLQPTDVIIGSVGLPKAAAINDDGVTFELSFKPSTGPDQLLFSKSVKYEETPAPIRQALTTLQPGQTGVFTLRVKGGNSLSYDWATWIELRLVRP